jgi:hypothetical protein
VIAKIEATGRFEAANRFGAGTAIPFTELSPRLRRSSTFACSNFEACAYIMQDLQRMPGSTSFRRMIMWDRDYVGILEGNRPIHLRAPTQEFTWYDESALPGLV